MKVELNLLDILALVLVVICCVVWCWGMWVMLTQGDDFIARFGRRLMKRLKRKAK